MSIVHTQVWWKERNFAVHNIFDETVHSLRLTIISESTSEKVYKFMMSIYSKNLCFNQQIYFLHWRKVKQQKYLYNNYIIFVLKILCLPYQSCHLWAYFLYLVFHCGINKYINKFTKRRSVEQFWYVGNRRARNRHQCRKITILLTQMFY